MSKRTTRALFTALACAAFALPLGAGAETGVSDAQGSGSSVQRNQNQQQGQQGMQKSETERQGTTAQSQDRYRMGTQTQTNLTEETKNDIRDVLVNVVENAVSADTEDLIDYLAKNDRDRLSNEDVDDAALSEAAERFRTGWEQKNDNSFADMFDRNSMQIEFVSGTPDQSATVKLTQGGESVHLKLVNQGTLMDSWKIDAPDSLTKQELHRKIQQALSENAQSMDKQKVASAILKPLSQPAA